MIEKNRPTPDQRAADAAAQSEIERMIEMRAELRAEAQAVRWRFRLAVIEAVLMTALVLVGGLLLKQPIGVVIRSAVLVGAACMVTAMLVIALSGACGILLSRLRQRRAKSHQSRRPT